MRGIWQASDIAYLLKFLYRLLTPEMRAQPPHGRAYVLALRPAPVHAGDMPAKLPLRIADIRVPVKRKKTLEAEKVEALAEDILENGQITPIRVREDGKGFVLIEGYHRLEAMRALGEEMVEGYIVAARLH